MGSRRKTEAVMISVEVFEELTAERTRATAEARASVRAEGLAPSPEADDITARWSRGEISTEQMRQIVRELHGAT
ncbi:antitoxin VbhA family protein [Nocardia grenadensis]|uniref:antitoxin VbhA family protein n=2 Tax=Nocardia TaxID=1817 RepID=UPI003D949BB6